MIVIDASAMVEALIGRDADDHLIDALQTSVHAPHLLDVEVISVMRGLTLAGKLKLHAAEQAQTDYFALTIVRYELRGLASRVWRLRPNYTAYDACYLALAEALDAPLYTCDRKLATEGHGAEILVFPRTH
ncbi:MAG: type II toxin-antitoxin system VapC family toxin [Natronosporangium sp.]